MVSVYTFRDIAELTGVERKRLHRDKTQSRSVLNGRGGGHVWEHDARSRATPTSYIWSCTAVQSEAIAANRITLHETGQADTIRNTHQCKPTSGMHKVQSSIELRLPVSEHLGVPGMVDKLVRFIKGLS